MLVRVETECTYDGPAEVNSGLNRLRLADEGVGIGGPVEVELLMLEETSYEDVVSHFGSDNARYPAPGTHVAQRLTLGSETQPGAESFQMPSGTYALVCFMADSDGVPFAQVSATD
jgi:hypothetical protein